MGTNHKAVKGANGQRRYVRVGRIFPKGIESAGGILTTSHARRVVGTGERLRVVAVGAVPCEAWVEHIGFVVEAVVALVAAAGQACLSVALQGAFVRRSGLALLSVLGAVRIVAVGSVDRVVVNRSDKCRGLEAWQEQSGKL